VSFKAYLQTDEALGTCYISG